MSNSHHVKYWVIFAGLCGLTALSVLFDVVDVPDMFPGATGLLVLALLVFGVAIAKALFVMLYFMHLKFEGRWKFVLLAPTVVLAIGLPLALFPDIGVHYYLTDVPQWDYYAEEYEHGDFHTAEERGDEAIMEEQSDH